MLLKRAKAASKTVVLPESDDERILKAAHIVLEKVRQISSCLDLRAKFQKSSHFGAKFKQSKGAKPSAK
ncbi:phosphate acyltransferase [Campylobacter concisus]